MLVELNAGHGCLSVTSKEHVEAAVETWCVVRPNELRQCRQSAADKCRVGGLQHTNDKTTVNTKWCVAQVADVLHIIYK